MDVAAHHDRFQLWSVLHIACVRFPAARKTALVLHRLLPDKLVYRVCWIPALLLYMLVAAPRAVRKFGPGARRLSELPLRQQKRILMRTCFRFPGLLPAEFYKQGFHLPKYATRIAGAGHSFDLRAISYLVSGKSVAGIERDMAFVHDKTSFSRFLEQQGLPAGPLLALFSRGSVEWRVSDKAIPKVDLFIKPAHEDAGRGARRIFFDPVAETYSIERPPAPMTGEDGLLAFAQVPLCSDELVRRLCRASERGDWILMPRLHNHPRVAALVGDTTLATLRITTIRDRQGHVAIFSIYWRVAISDSAVDNVSQGGFECQTDPSTGRVSAGYLAEQDCLLSVHPVTHAPIEGVVLPDIPEAVDLCIRAHRLLTEGARDYLFLIGFDVALTVTGPVFIEANMPGDLTGPYVAPIPLWRDPEFLRHVDSYLAPLRGRRTHFHPDL
ncbi:MAG: hypothetical protein K2Y51_13480 [Gammaproteobacteria bacterium]|jgi:hypothetical protein|nr:hypothetical protein [Gammaproteobacteria bacterium]